MGSLNFSAAFARYGATLKNVQWAVSSIANNQLVISCWAQYFQKEGEGCLVYRDRLSRWSGPGNNLLKTHLEEAVRDELPVRLVIARSEDPTAVASGKPASEIKKSFSVRPEFIGKLVEFDGDAFVIEFRKDDDLTRAETRGR